MVELRHSEGFWRLFNLGFGVWRRGRLAPTRVAPLPQLVSAQLTPDRPLLLVSNHVSWWDGFLLREVQVALRPKAPFHTAVLEEQLKAHPILRWLGGVPLDPHRPGSLAELLRALRRHRAAEPGSVLAWFPQGRIWPASRRPLGFRRGIEAAGRALAPATLIPVSIRIEPLVDPQPTPLLWIGVPLPVDADTPNVRARAESAVEDGLDRIEALLHLHGESILEHWP